MQKLHSPRSGMRPEAVERRRRTASRHRNSRGFSLIELMVTIGVVTILGAVAFAGMRQNEFEGQYLRFVQDVRGTLVAARNHAIDEQTPVRVDVDDDEVIVTAWNPVTDTWDLINRIVMTDQTDGLLITDNRVCIYGFGEGVQTPAQFAALGAGDIVFRRQMNAGDLSAFVPQAAMAPSEQMLELLMSADGAPVLIADTSEAVDDWIDTHEVKLATLH